MLILFTVRLKVNYHILVSFPSFYSFLFIDPLPLITDMVLILFGKMISEISKKKEKWSTLDGPGTIVALEQQHI